MTVIHAFPRTAGAEVDLHGKSYKFKPNSLGHVVCEVPEEAAVSRLLAITDHFREYEPPERPAAPPPAPGAGSGDPKYVLKSGDTELDLRAMDDKALHEFAKANQITVHHAAKGDTIRDKIVDALKSEG